MFKLFSMKRVFPKTKLQIYYLIIFVSYLGHHKNNYKYEFNALFICFCGKYCFVLEMPGKNKVGSILIKTCQFLYRWKKPNLCFFHSTLKFLIILLGTGVLCKDKSYFLQFKVFSPIHPQIEFKNVSKAPKIARLDKFF